MELETYYKRNCLQSGRLARGTTFLVGEHDQQMATEGSNLFSIDGRWGWIAVIGAFVAHVITHGIVYSFGILFVAIDETYEASKAEISWIPSITTGCLYLVGPVASLLINRYGSRVTTVLGAVLSSVGFILSMFVSRLHLLYLTMGIVAGCGLGMVFLSAILVVTGYFVKYRALACGIALSGAGGGAFIMSPVIEHLLKEYAWKGTLLFLAGILLNCIPCGLLFLLPVDEGANKFSEYYTKPDKGTNKEGIAPNMQTNMEELISQMEDHTSLLKETDFEHGTINNIVNIDRRIRGDNSDSRDDHGSKNQSDKNVDTEQPGNSCITYCETTEASLFSVSSREEEHGTLSVANCNISSSLETCQTNELKIHCQPGQEKIDLVYESDDHQNSNAALDSASANVRKKSHNLRDNTKLISQRYKKIFTTRDVAIFFISQFLFFAGFYLPFIYIPDKVKEHGIQDSRVAWIASTMGISSIAGRIFLGYVADRASVNRILMFKLMLFLAGASTAFVPLLNSLWLLIVYAVVYGVSSGVTLSLTSVVLVDLAGISLLPDAMGVNNVFSAAGALIGPPLAGLLFDVTGSYTASFLTSGLIMSLASVILCGPPKCRAANS